MAEYTFTGKVHPERAAVWVDTLAVKFVSKEAGLELEAELAIGGSQITVLVKPTVMTCNIATLKNYVETIVRLAVDVVGYRNGCGYDVEITSAIASDGSDWNVFGVQEPILEKTVGERPTE